MNISELISELERMREMHGDLIVTKNRNGEEVNHVYIYGGYKCLLHSDIDDLMDEIIRYTNNHKELRRICDYIVQEELLDTINELKKDKDDFHIDIGILPSYSYPSSTKILDYSYLTIEIWNDSHKQALKQIQKIHSRYDYCLNIIYHSTTDYDIKTYELPVKPDTLKLLG